MDAGLLRVEGQEYNALWIMAFLSGNETRLSRISWRPPG